MKKPLSLLIAVIIVFSANAQYQSIFGQNSTSWIYNSYYLDGLNPNWFYTQSTTGKDSLINGKIYQEIYELAQDGSFNYFFLREDTTTGSVFKLESLGESKQMTMNLAVGDSFTYSLSGGIPNPVVDSVFYDSMGRKVIQFDHFAHLLPEKRLIFIEGIGANGRIMGMSGIELLCSYKDGMKVFTNDFGHSCSSIGIHERFIQPLKVYPNPAKDFLTLELEQPNSTHFKIFNLNGAIVLEGQLEVKTEINVRHFPSGLYIIQFSNGESTFYQKFVKQ